MSETNRISPLLDGFLMGDSVSKHHGVRCHPAIREESEEKYIVKVIAVPATQAQFDAFLMAGAYQNPADAMAYFRSVAEGIAQEAQLLKDMSRLGGFLAYESWQVSEITRHRVGFEVALLAPYRMPLEKYMRKHIPTQKDAMGLALDLCRACNLCRQSGSLYVDLKPGNIFLSEEGEYCIGDLGFLRMEELSYTSLPEKYLSRYTAPEMRDPMATVGMTVDTYALGMILYQLYNESKFPDQKPGEPIPAPIHADYEFAEIILKAIDENPEKRWEDPQQMAQAILAYLERNPAAEEPITPYIPLDVEAQDVRLPQKRPEASEKTEAVKEASPVAAEPSGKVTLPEETAAEAPVLEEAVSEEPAPEESSSEAPVTEPVPEELPPEKPMAEASVPEEVPPEEPVLEMEPASEESTPEEPSSEGFNDPKVSDEMTRILSKADDLIAHETPAGVVVPEIPEDPDPFAFATEDSVAAAELEMPLDPLMEDAVEVENTSGKKKGKFRSDAGRKKAKRFFGNVAGIAILAGICGGGFWGYQNLYLQTVESMQISGSQNQIAVQLQTQAKDALLHVTCTNGLGYTVTADVVNGYALFSDLQPNTTYSISVGIDGFHGLAGHTSDSFTTDAATWITSFTAVTGSEDGSVVLNFAYEGKDPESWILTYGIPEVGFQSISVTDQMIPIEGLSPGKTYTFVLSTSDGALGGSHTITHLVKRVILAANLTVSTTEEGKLMVQWTTPGDLVVDRWGVRCYNESGESQVTTVTDTRVVLDDIDTNRGYTVEITADGMTQPARLSITPNPIAVTNWKVDDSNSKELKLQWEYTGNAPEGGWLLLYQLNGNPTQNVIKCKTPSAVLQPYFPGTEYTFILLAADGTTVLDGVRSFALPEAPAYSGNHITASDVTARTLKTPEDPNWRYETVGEAALTDTFSVGDPVSLVLFSGAKPYLPNTSVDVRYVIQDIYGNLLTECASEAKVNWKKLWSGGDTAIGELNVPTVPQTPGTYQIKVYINGSYLCTAEFTIP